MTEVGRDALPRYKDRHKTQKDAIKISRRTLLKGAGAGVGLLAAGVAARAIFGSESSGWEVLVSETPVGPIKGKIYPVRSGWDTIGAIARGYASTEEYNTDQMGYDKKILQANGMETPRIFVGQEVYVPDFDTPTYGVSLGKEALGVKFEAVDERDGKKYVRITTLGKTISVAIGKDRLPEKSLVFRRQSGAPQFMLASYLPGMPAHKVPDRIVFEQVKPQGK